MNLLQPACTVRWDHHKCILSLSIDLCLLLLCLLRPTALQRRSDDALHVCDANPTYGFALRAAKYVHGYFTG